VFEAIEANSIRREDPPKLLRGTRKYLPPKGVIPQLYYGSRPWCRSYKFDQPNRHALPSANDPCYYAQRRVASSVSSARYSILIKEERFRSIRRGDEGERQGVEFRAYFCSIERQRSLPQIHARLNSRMEKAPRVSHARAARLISARHSLGSDARDPRGAKK